MAGYDPQRNRRRPTVAADDPAPVDALLGAVSEDAVSSPPQPNTVTVVSPESAATPSPDPSGAADQEPAPPSPAQPMVPSAPYVPTAPSAAQRSRSRMLMLASGSVVALVVVVLLRRRRRS